MLEHTLKVCKAFITKGMRNLRDAHICLLQIPLGFSNAVNIGVFTDRIAGDFFENAADIGFTQVEFFGQLFQGDGTFAVLREIIGNAVGRFIFGIVGIVGRFLMLTADKLHQLKKPGQDVQVNSDLVVAVPVGQCMADAAEQIQNQCLLFPVQMIDSVEIIQKLHQMQGRVERIVGFHFFPCNVQNDTVVSCVGTGDGFGHVDQVGIDQYQVPGTGDVFAVVEEKDAFANNI